jgi:hypothetical protein
MGKPKKDDVVVNKTPIQKNIEKIKNVSQPRCSSLNRLDARNKSLISSKSQTKPSIIDITKETFELDIAQYNVANEAEMIESDQTDSEIDENEKLHKQKFRNKSKSIYEPVRHLFIKVNKSLYRCNDCAEDVKTSASSDGNLRLHLASKHGYTDVLFESQRNRKFHNKNNLISISDKKRYHNAAVECILTDSRPFSDFSKTGMKAFLNEIRPGYKPPSRHLIRKCVTKK